MTSVQDEIDAQNEALRVAAKAVLASRVSEHEANQVLHYFSGSEGYPAGSFVQRLLSAFAHADSPNFTQLEGGFPSLGAAMRLAMHYPGGLDVLREIAKGGDTNE